MGQIESPGTYIAKIVDHGLDETRNGYPQLVARFQLQQKYVEDLHELQHFHGQGVVESRDEQGQTFDPQWVDWSAFDEYTTGFFVLFNTDGSNGFDMRPTNEGGNKLLNYGQLQLATGWAGDDFEPLNNGSFLDQEVLLRVKEDEYNGQTQLKADWIDAKTATPGRELRKADEDKVKSLSAKLKAATGGGKAAKPAKSSEKKKEEKPAEEKQEKPKAPPKKGPPKKEEKKEEPQQEGQQDATEDEASLPKAVSQGDAWEFVCNHKGDNADSAIEEAWIAACEEVGPETDEEDFTEEMWAQVRDNIVRDLALDV